MYSDDAAETENSSFKFWNCYDQTLEQYLSHETSNK